MKSNFKSLSFVLATVIVSASLAAGCKGGDEGGPKPDAAVVNTGTQMRTYFDNAHGDYNALSATDRAAFVKLFNGDEKRAQEVWTVMKNGSSPRAGSAAPGG